MLSTDNVLAISQTHQTSIGPGERYGVQKGRGGMGSHKYGVSGCGEGPALRRLDMMARREEQNDRRRKLRFPTVRANALK
jgi:hypothetical protein